MGSNEDIHDSKGKVSSRRRSWALVAVALFLATAMAVRTSFLRTASHPFETEIGGSRETSKKTKVLKIMGRASPDMRSVGIRIDVCLAARQGSAMLFR